MPTRFGPEHQNVRSATLGTGSLLVPGDTFETAPRITAVFDLPRLTALTASWTPFADGANLNAQNLQTILNRVSAEGGGTVFFPPGRYYLGRSNTSQRDTPTTEAPDLLVHPNVVLEFAPGAVLVPMNFTLVQDHRRERLGREDEEWLVIVEVQGAIKAGLHEIFATTLYPRNDFFPYEPELPAGKVVFTGSQVREVYPEWWGAFSQYDGHWGVRNRRAFQAAIDAGHTDRYRLIRDRTGSPWGFSGQPSWRQEPTIPVVAMYEYYIEGTLEVGLTTTLSAISDELWRRSNPAPFVMYGGAEPSVDNSTLRAMADPTSLNLTGVPAQIWKELPMLAMEGVSSFYLEGVSFDGYNLVQGIVNLTLGAQEGVGEFKRCTFKNVRSRAEATLVTVSSARRDVAGAEEAVHLAFTACRMTPIILNYRPYGTSRTASNLPGTIIYAPRVRGLLLDCDDHCSVELRACHLQGVCDPMIHARRGRFALNECVLHGNRSVQTTAPTARPSPATMAEWRRFWNSNSGTDIFIDQPRAVGGVVEAPASFTARELESQSFQFVSTWADGNRVDGPRASYVVINAHHTAAPASSSTADMSQGDPLLGGGADPQPMPANQFRPSVSWEGPGQLGCHFVLMGVCFKNSYPAGDGETTADLGGIRLGPNQRGTIFQLANTTADPPDRRGTFRSAADAVAPRSFIRWDSPIISPGEIREPVIASFPRPTRSR